MNIIQQLMSKKDLIIKEQEKYNTKAQDSEIAVLENELNRKVSVRNSTLDIYKDYERQVERIDQTIRAVNELTLGDNTPEPEIPEEDEDPWYRDPELEEELPTEPEEEPESEPEE